MIFFLREGRHLQNKFPNVRFLAPDRVFVSEEATIGDGAIIYPDNYIYGRPVIEAGAVLRPENILEDAFVGAGSEIEKSVLRGARVGKNCTVGPFAHLRKGANVGDNCRVGDFVEIKNSVVGAGTKVRHLAYVGDADVGEYCNIGCGVVFCNYDGKNKHRTRVGNNCFIGSNVNLIAPVEIADGAFVAAGTTVTEGAGKGDFVIGRVRQQIRAGGAKRYLGGEEK